MAGPKPIQDEFTHLGVSRQRKCQLRWKRDGMCCICGQPTVLSKKSKPIPLFNPNLNGYYLWTSGVCHIVEYAEGAAVRHFCNPNAPAQRILRKDLPLEGVTEIPIITACELGLITMPDYVRQVERRQLFQTFWREPRLATLLVHPWELKAGTGVARHLSGNGGSCGLHLDLKHVHRVIDHTKQHPEYDLTQVTLSLEGGLTCSVAVYASLSCPVSLLDAFDQKTYARWVKKLRADRLRSLHRFMDERNKKHAVETVTLRKVFGLE